MIQKYLFQDPSYDITVGYDCRLPEAKSMATYTAKTYKGLLYSENEAGERVLISDHTKKLTKKIKKISPTSP